MHYYELLSFVLFDIWSKLNFWQGELLYTVSWRYISRSSHQRCSVRKGALRKFVKFTGKHLCQGLLFNKVAGLRSVTLLKNRLCHRCFPVNFAKFPRTPFSQNTSGRLLLYFWLTVPYKLMRLLTKQVAKMFITV